MEKNIAVVAGNDVHDVVIRAGTTVEDVLNQLKLPSDYCLSRRDGLPLGPMEDLFGLVRNGEKLFASAPAVVGSKCLTGKHYAS